MNASVSRTSLSATFTSSARGMGDRDLEPPVEVAAQALQSALDELLQAAATS